MTVTLNLIEVKCKESVALQITSTSKEESSKDDFSHDDCRLVSSELTETLNNGCSIWLSRCLLNADRFLSASPKVKERRKLSIKLFRLLCVQNERKRKEEERLEYIKIILGRLIG